jgi:hypothetical protein
MADPLAVDPRYMPRFSDMNGSRDKASPFWGGLGAGVHQLLGLGGSALQGIANLEGADQVAALGRNFANDQNRIAARIRPDLDIAPWQEGGAHVLPWAEYQLGKLAPTLAGFVGATALAPEAAATTAIARGLPTFLGGAGAGATPEAAAAAGRFVLGGGAFGGGLGFGQAVQSADQQPGGATAADSVQALAESPLYAGASLLTPGFLKGALGKGGGNALTRIASKGLEGSAVGAFQSGSMTALDQTFRPDLTPKQKMDNIVDATVTGAAVAGLAGGLAGGLPGSRKIQRVDPNQLTVEHLDEATAAVDPAAQQRPEPTQTEMDLRPSPEAFPTGYQPDMLRPGTYDDLAAANKFRSAKTEDLIGVAQEATDYLGGLPEDHRLTEADAKIRNNLSMVNAELQRRNQMESSAGVETVPAGAVEPSPTDTGAAGGAELAPAPAKQSFSDKLVELRKGLRLPGRFVADINGVKNGNELLAKVHDAIFDQQDKRSTVAAFAQRLGLLDDKLNPTPLADTISARKAEQRAAEAPVDADPAFQQRWAALTDKVSDKTLKAMKPANEAQAQRLVYEALTADRAEVSDDVEKMGRTLGLLDSDKKPTFEMVRLSKADIPLKDEHGFGTVPAAEEKGFKGTEISQFDRGARFVGTTEHDIADLTRVRDERAQQVHNELEHQVNRQALAFKKTLPDEHIETIVKGLQPDRTFTADEMKQHIADFKDQLLQNTLGDHLKITDEQRQAAVESDPVYKQFDEKLNDALAQDLVELPEFSTPREFAAFMEGRAWAHPETLSSAETKRIIKDYSLGNHFDAGHRLIPDEQRAQRPLNERIDAKYPPTKYPTENAQLKSLIREGDDEAAIAEAERYLKSGHGGLITPPAPERAREPNVRPTIYGDTVVPDRAITKQRTTTNADDRTARQQLIHDELKRSLALALDSGDMQSGDYIHLRQALDKGDNDRVREALADIGAKPYININGREVTTGRDWIAAADLLQRQNLFGGGAKGLMSNLKDVGGPLGNMAARFEKYVPDDVQVDIITPAEMRHKWEVENGISLPSGKVPVGTFDPTERRIYLSTKMDHPSVALHEIVHAITEDHITNKSPIGREMIAAYERFKKAIPDSDYAYTNAHEFMSEFLARQQVRDYIKNAQPTVFQRVWNAIRQMFGMPSQDYVERVLKLAERAGANPYGRIEKNSPPILARLVDDQVKSAVDTSEKVFKADSLRGVARKVALGWATVHDIGEHWAKWFDPSRLGEEFATMANPVKAYEGHLGQKVSIVARMAQMMTTARDSVQHLIRINPVAGESLVRLMRMSEFGIDPTKDWDAQTDAVKNSSNESLKALHADAHKLWNDKIVRNGFSDTYRNLRDVNDVQMLSQMAVTLHAQVAADTVASAELAQFGSSPMERFLDAQNSEDFTPRTAREWWARELNNQLSSLDDHFRTHRSAADQITGDSKKEVNDKADILRRIDPLAKRAKNIKQAVAQLDEAPYFHLGRFGNHFVGWDVADKVALGRVADTLEAAGFRGVVSRESEKTNTYMRLENQEQATRLRQILEAQEPGLIKPGSIISGERTSETIRTSMADQWFNRMIEDIKASEDLSAEAKKEAEHSLRDLHLDLMPENSITRVMTKRDNVPGYDPDMLRAFEHRANVGINALAGMVISPKISRAFTDMRTLEEAAQRASTTKVSSAQRTGMTNIIDELSTRERERSEWPETKFLDQLRATNHAWFLGGSVSYGLVNLTQLGATLLPELGARHGFAKAFGVMAREATPDALRIIRAIWQEGRNVSLSRAMDAVVTRSALTKAGIRPEMAEFIMRVANSGELDIGGPSRELMRAAAGRGDGKIDATLRYASAIGYYTETLSRLVAALSSYHLDKIADPEKAADRAVHVLKESMWDYSQANQGRQFGKKGILGPYTPLATAFMQYTAQLSGKLYRETYEAIKGETEGERAEARRFLFQHAVSMTVLAGSLGLPMVSAMAATVDRLKDAFDDDGKPSDVRAAWRNMLADTFGKEAGEVLSRGAPRALGIDLSTRVGEQDILPFSRTIADRRNFKDAIKDMQSRSWGAPASMVSNAFQGGEKIANGDFLGGMQRMLPNALAAPVKAYQMSEKGFVDSNGKTLPMSPSAANIAAQLIGFNSATNAEYAESRQDVAVRKGILTRQATVLRNGLVNSILDEDRDTARSTLEQIREFNSANPDFSITGQDIEGALRRRAQAQAISDVTKTPLGTSPSDLDAKQLTRYANIDYAAQ